MTQLEAIALKDLPEFFQSRLDGLDDELRIYVAHTLASYTQIDRVGSAFSNSSKFIPLEEVRRNGSQGGRTEKRTAFQQSKEIGDLTLYWVGIFPNGVTKNHRRKYGIEQYLNFGRQAYASAMQFANSLQYNEASIMDQMSENFTSIAKSVFHMRMREDPSLFVSFLQDGSIFEIQQTLYDGKIMNNQTPIGEKPVRLV